MNPIGKLQPVNAFRVDCYLCDYNEVVMEERSAENALKNHFYDVHKVDYEKTSIERPQIAIPSATAPE